MSTRPPRNLFAIANQNTTVTANGVDGYPNNISVNTGFGIGNYRRTTKGRDVQFLDGNLKEVFQIRGFSSRSDNCTADSPLEAAALEVRQQLSGTRHNLKVIDNGGRLSMAVIFKNRMTPEDWDVREQSIREKFSGSNNAGRIAVMSAPDMEIKEMGQSNKDMDFTALDTKSREAVFMRYGVPLPLISSTRQTFNNFCLLYTSPSPRD